MELRLVEVQVHWWAVQMVSGSWVGECGWQANSQPSRHNFLPAGLQATCSHQPGCYCMFLTVESQNS